jgi:predicted transcriptional regulator
MDAVPQAGEFSLFLELAWRINISRCIVPRARKGALAANLVMEKPPGPAPGKHQYLYSRSVNESEVRRKADEAHAQGYEVVDQVDQLQSSRHYIALVLERAATTT